MSYAEPRSHPKSESSRGVGGLSCRLVEPGVSVLHPERFALGVVHHGASKLKGSSVAWGEETVVARTPLQPLATPWVELFESPKRPRRARSRGIDLAEDGTVLFGKVEIEEGPLEEVSYDAFVRLLEVIRDRGYPHPLRIWVTIPGINCEEDGLERYQAFCRGRSLAFEAAHGVGFAQRLCASSAVGSESGPVAIYFLASTVNGTHCENPRQLAAYRYPREYGPRSPSFARATVAPAALGGARLIAGTASIVGHENQHPGDVLAQLRETVQNLDVLVASLPTSDGCAAPLSTVKVYLRRAEDLSAVRGALEATGWGRGPVLYLRADICREPLLIEIEAL